METEIKDSEKLIMSLDYILLYIKRNFPHIQTKSITPFSFTIGSKNNDEPIQNTLELPNSLFFGTLQICINPTDAILQAERIRIKYRSYLNRTPFFKTITRMVETENLINESSESKELFDSISITQTSTKYDFYLTFLGFKIDYN